MESSQLYTFGLTKPDNVMTGAILTSDGTLEENSVIFFGNVEDNYNRLQESEKQSIECVIGAIELLSK